MLKNMSANAEDAKDTSPISRLKKIPWSRKWQPTPVSFLKIPWTEEPSRPWGPKELDTTGYTHTGEIYI